LADAAVRLLARLGAEGLQHHPAALEEAGRESAPHDEPASGGAAGESDVARTVHIVFDPDCGWPHAFTDPDQARRFAERGCVQSYETDLIHGESGDALIADHYPDDEPPPAAPGAEPVAP
jgi:hypothetical protein